MQNKDKIIVALDVDSLDAAEALVRELSPHVGAFKVGLELVTACGAGVITRRLQALGAKIFFDGKFKDIPATVAAASREVTKLGVFMFNVHAMGGRGMMEAAAEAATCTARTSDIPRPLVLGVTVLTSMDAKALGEIGFDINNEEELKEQVVRLARLAKSSGLDGVVASPREVRPIREACGGDFKIVTPGVRPLWAASNDQRRIATPKDAVGAGADYLVIGRPITRPPKEIGGPVEAAKKIAGEISG